MMERVRNLSELTLGEAEEMKKAGAVLELRADGKIVIYNEESGDKTSVHAVERRKGR